MTSFLKQVLDQNGFTEAKCNPIQKIILPNSKSNIVQKNCNIIYCFSVGGLEGLFRKDFPLSYAYGRQLCDDVKSKFSNQGFFTSDELPRYGISSKEQAYVYRQMNKNKGDKNLLIFLVYKLDHANEIRNYLCSYWHTEAHD